MNAWWRSLLVLLLAVLAAGCARGPDEAGLREDIQARLDALFGRQVLFTDWAILGKTFHIYQPEFLPSLPVLMVLLVGFGTANILFWSRPFTKAGYPPKSSGIKFLCRKKPRRTN